jgi:1,2-dihydroxy-3-keto-5-methylthiopentene dioxygenase
MATLHCPDIGLSLESPDDIQAFLNARGIFYEQWAAPCVFAPGATQEQILKAYAPVLEPYMAKNGYQTADVISVDSDTPNIAALKAKFLPEHIHTEDEVRFFVDGHGDFWFNLAEPEKKAGEAPISIFSQPPFCVRCVAGDLLSVPAGYPHWFDLGEKPFVKAIRIFTDASGWTPLYTERDVHTRYCQV